MDGIKIYQELYWLYSLLGVLIIVLAILLIVLFVYKAHRKKGEKEQENQNKKMITTAGIVTVIPEAESKEFLTTLNKDKTFEEIVELMQTAEFEDKVQHDEIGKGKSSLSISSDELTELETKKNTVSKLAGTEQEIATSEVENESNENKVLERNAKQKEYQERYLVIKEELTNHEKYSVAHNELLARESKIKKGLELFERVVYSESNVKITNQVEKTINNSLLEVEKDMKAVPIVVELSKNIIPRMIAEKLNEYEKQKRNGKRVDKGVLVDLRGKTAELSEILTRIRKLELEGLLEELMGIAKRIDKMSVEENE